MGRSDGSAQIAAVASLAGLDRCRPAAPGHPGLFRGNQLNVHQIVRAAPSQRGGARHHHGFRHQRQSVFQSHIARSEGADWRR